MSAYLGSDKANQIDKHIEREQDLTEDEDEFYYLWIVLNSLATKEHMFTVYEYEDNAKSAAKAIAANNFRHGPEHYTTVLAVEVTARTRYSLSLKEEEV